MCGVSHDGRTGVGAVRWLFGGCMLGLFVPLVVSFLAMPGLCCVLCVTPGEHYTDPAGFSSDASQSTCPSARRWRAVLQCYSDSARNTY